MAREVAQANIRFTQLVHEGEPYAAGTEVGSSVEIMGDALTALEASATSLAAIETLLTAIDTAIGAAADVAGANTVIGQLKQIAENTTPAP